MAGDNTTTMSDDDKATLISDGDDEWREHGSDIYEEWNSEDLNNSAEDLENGECDSKKPNDFEWGSEKQSLHEVLLKAVARHPEIKDWLRHPTYERPHTAYQCGSCWNSDNAWADKAYWICIDFDDFDYSQKAEYDEKLEELSSRIKDLFSSIIREVGYDSSYETKAKAAEVMFEIIGMFVYAEADSANFASELYRCTDGACVKLAGLLCRFKECELERFFTEDDKRFRIKFDLLLEKSLHSHPRTHPNLHHDINTSWRIIKHIR
ncbi:hypothetical protein B0T21DRAFT_348989 [Apiosordaria backusii]|uniref:Uncharacterized protein n=1 Tax=Apiosordaria backusii TaxID=314023 RepID=A0AA40BJR8_9PEZI|nr:hypothetical protein B0T21DRAFT_348989 [Apiosordaria backusii]